MRPSSQYHIYRLASNEPGKAFIRSIEQGWIQTTRKATPGVSMASVHAHEAGARARKWRRGLTTLASALAFAGFSHAAELPTGGAIMAGSGNISLDGTVLTINQSSDKLATDWQGFSIGRGHSVNFVQPSSSAIALNRVLGSDVSVIQGVLKANGQVFLLNPNGVTFTPSAQVEAGALIASTLSLSTGDFLAGKYRFEGVSANAIVNQGAIRVANGGTIALIAARVSNEGELAANEGNVLIGAGSKVTLDLGGPVKIRVDEGIVNALIENGGAIKADGGQIFLSAKAAGDVVSTVINHTGMIEARTLATGEKGQIYLLGDFENDRLVVGGTLDASALNGGNGGFIETSAADVRLRDDIRVTAAAPGGQAGRWLIDPSDITISASSCTGANCIPAAAISSTLNGGTDVTIATSATENGAERGDIHFNADLAWNQGMLTLSAHNDIWIRGNLSGAGSARLALEYGQGVDDWYNMTTYTILGSLSLPAGSFSAKHGSGQAAWMDVPVFLNNGLLRFGDGTRDSVNDEGTLRQPFYYNANDKRWYKLTYSDSPMYINVGFGGSGYSDGTILSHEQGRSNSDWGGFEWDGPYFRNLALDARGFVNGTGTLVATNIINDGDVTLTISNTYTLPVGKNYLEATTTITNGSAGTVENVRLWTGSRDDWIGLTDGPRKEKGNIVDGVFVPNTATGQASSVIRVTSNTEGILFYSTSVGAETTIGRCCSPNFHINTAGDWAPLASPRDTPFDSGPVGPWNYSTDGNYSVSSSFGSLAPNAGRAIVWYYGAGDVASLATIVSTVADAAEVAVPTPQPAPQPEIQVPSPQPQPSPVPQPDIEAPVAQPHPAPVLRPEIEVPAPQPQAPIARLRDVPAPRVTSASALASVRAPAQRIQNASTELGTASGQWGPDESLEFIEVSPTAYGRDVRLDAPEASQSGDTGDAEDAENLAIRVHADAAPGATARVFIVSGGIRLPRDASLVGPQ